MPQSLGESAIFNVYHRRPPTPRAVGDVVGNGTSFVNDAEGPIARCSRWSRSWTNRCRRDRPPDRDGTFDVLRLLGTILERQ